MREETDEEHKKEASEQSLESAVRWEPENDAARQSPNDISPYRKGAGAGMLDVPQFLQLAMKGPPQQGGKLLDMEMKLKVPRGAGHQDVLDLYRTAMGAPIGIRRGAGLFSFLSRPLARKRSKRPPNAWPRKSRKKPSNAWPRKRAKSGVGGGHRRGLMGHPESFGSAIKRGRRHASPQTMATKRRRRRQNRPHQGRKHVVKRRLRRYHV